MINSTALILCGLVLVLGVVLDVKKGVSLGITAMAGAFLIGIGYMKLSATVIVAGFPSSTVVTILLAVPYFSMLSGTGMMGIVGKKMLRMAKGDGRIIPFIAAIAVGVVALVAGTQIPFIFGPLLIAFAEACGLDYLIILGVMIFATPFGSGNPWTSLTGQTIQGELIGSGIENAQAIGIAVWGNVILAFLSVIVILYFVFKGHKAKSSTLDINEDLTFNPIQKKAFTLFVATILILLIPAALTKLFPSAAAFKYISTLCVPNVIFPLGTLICALMGIGKYNEALRKLPMPAVMLIVGVNFLLTVASNAGFQELISGLISDNIPTFLIPAAFAFAAGALSFVASFFVVLPLLWGVAAPVCAATGVNAAVVMSCIVIAGIGTGCSPLSSSGAANMSVMPADKQPELTKKMMIVSLCVLVWYTILAALGVFGIIPSIMGL